MKALQLIGGVRVFVEDLAQYASEAYVLYTRFITNHHSQAKDLVKIKGATAIREEVIQRMAEAFVVNLDVLIEIQKILAPYTIPSLLVQLKPHENDDIGGYLKDHRYLKRDWGWDAASELQLQSIKTALLEGIKANLPKGGKTLFLGAGVGRIAFDLADYFQKVYVTDKSFSMAYHYKKLLTSTVRFFEMDDRNLYSAEDSVREVTATMFPPHLDRTHVEIRLNKIDYFVSDVRKLPFEDQSLDSVFSVYFTDVVALKFWLPEIKRVLKPSGFFTHFGPLDYFFRDINEMLSANEIKQVFRDNGFDSVHDHMVETLHLPSLHSLTNKSYTNWCYVAKLGISLAPKVIGENDRVLLVGKANYVVRGVIGGGQIVEQNEITLADGDVYEGASALIEILKIINENTEGILVRDIFSRLAVFIGDTSEKDIEVILTSLKILAEHKIISIVN